MNRSSGPCVESDNNGCSDDEDIELSQSLVEDMNSSNILTLEEIPAVDVERRKTIIEVLRTLNIISQNVSERIMETPMPSPIRRNVLSLRKCSLSFNMRFL